MTQRRRAVPDDVPVGSREVAELLAVQPQTVHAWRTRGVLPSPDFQVSGRPAWWRSTILAWAYNTGRLRDRRSSLAAEERGRYEGPDRRRA